MSTQCWLQDLASDLRLEEVLDRTIENALRALPGHDCALALVVGDELRVVRTSALGPGARRRLEAWARGAGDLLADACEVGDLDADPRLAALARRAGRRALRSAPLLCDRRSLGALIVLAPEPFDDRRRELLAEFCDQAALALRNAHLFQALLENATHDELTALPNRREFDRLLRRELGRSSRYGEIFSLAILDLDAFKAVNDSRGHAAGDDLLRQAAQTIEEACRAADVAARLGGDEFAILLPETNQFEAAALCERLRAEVETLAEVSLSWGVAEYPTHGVSAAQLTRAADAAMYASKPRLAGAERVATG